MDSIIGVYVMEKNLRESLALRKRTFFNPQNPLPMSQNCENNLCPLHRSLA